MSNESLMNKLEKTATNNNVPLPPTTVQGLLGDVKVKKRFEELLGKKSQGFMTSIINVVNGNTDLKECDPNTVIGSAGVAASLDLPIDPNLGFAYIVPFNTKVGGKFVKKAQFMLGYKGFVQLAMRSGAYKTISASEIYEGEIVSYNRITSEIELGEPTSDKVVGYIAYFKLLNGFEKYLYMTKQEIENHAKTFSKTYASEYGIWKKDFNGMAVKTVLKRLLSKYGILSIEMNSAIVNDQGVIPNLESVDETVDYVDNPLNDKEKIIDIEIK